MNFINTHFEIRIGNSFENTEKYKSKVYGYNLNWSSANEENYNIILILETFKLRKNFSFDRFVYQLNYYYLMELICAMSQENNVFDKEKCGLCCPVWNVLNKMGYKSHRKKI